VPGAGGVMLEGGILEFNLVERLIEMWRDRFTGAIRFENDGIIKIIYFKDGEVLSASTNDRADSVDEILMRAGKVSREHVKQALAKRKESETLGDALLNLGFITRKELTWGRRVQAINVIRSVGEWGAGTFTIVADYLPKREEGTIFPLPQLIVELIVTDPDRNKFEKALESGSAVFEKSPDYDKSFRQLGLNEDAEAVMAQVDGQRSASEVASVSRQDAFNSFKLLHALSLLGILKRKGVPAPVAVGVTDSFESAGVADASDAWAGEMPKFDLDDAPAVSVAPLPGLPDIGDLDALPESPMQSIPEPEPQMPAWDSSAIEAPAPEPALQAVDEQQWGFDEAQIETVQKATLPPPVDAPAFAPPIPPASARRTVSGTSVSSSGVGNSTSTLRKSPLRTPPPKRSRFGFVVALMVVFIIAGAAYAGFMWWQARENAPTAVVQRPVARPRVTTPPPVTQTIATVVPTAKPVPPPVTATVAPPLPRVAAGAPARRAAPDAGAATPASKYETMARDYAANPNASFAVQFAIVCEASNVTKALSNGGTNVWFVPISIKGRACYRMYWGRYSTRDDAERGMAALPASLRESKPAVVSISR